VNQMSSAGESWPDTGQTSLAIETSADYTLHESMSCAEDFRVRTSVLLERVPGLTGRARVFGQSTPASLAKLSPDGSSWRTFQLCLLEEWTEFSETWPRSGMTRSTTAFQLQPLVPRTRGIASGLLPTPTEAVNMQSPSMLKWQAHRNLWPTPTANEGNGAGHASQGSPNLRTMVERFPTPNARDYKDSGDTQGNRKSPNLGTVAAMWPTPTARLADERGPQIKRYKDPQRSTDLDDAVAASGTPGKLNPTWVEWLMGFPAGWTDLGASATLSSPRSPSGSESESSSTSDPQQTLF